MEQSTPSPGASWERQRRAVVLAVATDAALAALLVLLGTVLAGGMTVMTGWRPEVVLLVSVLVAIPLLARQVRRGRRALAAAQTGSRVAPPPRPADSERPAAPIRIVASIDEATEPVHATGTPENGEVAGALADGPGDGRRLPAAHLPEEIGARLLGLARREVRADSAAVLVPDGGTWMVISDADLPDTTGTLRITAAHQMIDEVLYPRRPRIVNGSDRMPGDLPRLPLPASDHLLAVPLRHAESVILLSRAHPPFHREELRLLSGVLDLQGTMLDLAVKMLKLRKDLHEALDEPGRPSSPRG